MALVYNPRSTPTAKQVAGFTYDGADYSTLKPDGTFGLTFKLITNSKQIVAQHVARRWRVEQGDLDVSYIGVGLRRYLNMSLSVSQRDQLEATLREQALGVDGVSRCTVTVSQKRLPGFGVELTARATLTLERRFGGETFTTVFALTATTARLIVEGQIT